MGTGINRRLRAFLHVFGPGALALGLAACEGRSLPPQDDGDFGIEEGEEADSDELPSTTDPTGDPTSASSQGTGPDMGADTGPDPCFSVVADLHIDDDTHPDSVSCIERVTGDLTVGPTTALLDLDMLANLRQVDGALFLHGNLALTSLDSLAALEQVSWLHVRRNHNLSSLAGLAGLTAVERITVSNNEGMTSVAGLPDGLAPKLVQIDNNDLLPSVDGLPLFIPPETQGVRVELVRNPALVDLGGLSDCCADVSLALELDTNPALTDLDGLEAFVRLESLELRDNFGLIDLDGLDSLIEVQTTFEISYDHCIPGAVPSLVDFGGAEQLAEVGTLELDWISSLVSFSGFDQVSSVQKLFVRNNDGLAWAAIEAFKAQTAPGTFELCGGVDGPTCPTDPCPMF